MNTLEIVAMSCLAISLVAAILLVRYCLAQEKKLKEEAIASEYITKIMHTINDQTHDYTWQQVVECISIIYCHILRPTEKVNLMKGILTT